MAGTITIDDAAVRAMAANPAVTAAFPFLRSPTPRRGCCRASRPAAKSPAAVMRSLLSLPPDRRAEFKRLLGVDRVIGTVVRAARSRKEEF